ncbi:Fic family protein [Salicibibacter kimchii]|uniref:Fic family protein n=1 Tax=Salicibibacter kimchii TaxID=2099786 RepID=A0A345C1P0_9BACI|nr:Fic family protein [Salicibibacter kimchii]AXF57121.1 Fic family protein [Salicibibacter kimchii]
MQNIEKATELKKQLDRERPLDTVTVQRLKEDFFIRNTYHSNAIEGNTLTIYETKAILEDGITVGNGKTLREHMEVINHRDAIQYVESVVTQPLTERIIRSIHSLILRGIDADHAGTYRHQDVIITGASHSVTSPLKISDDMEDLIRWYTSAIENNNDHPIEIAAILHSKFVNIHPFLDGNGRTGRLLMNFELMRAAYLPVIIQVDERQKYYEVLDHAGVHKDYTMLIDMVASLEVSALEKYLELL